MYAEQSAMWRVRHSSAEGYPKVTAQVFDFGNALRDYSLNVANFVAVSVQYVRVGHQCI